MPYYTEARNEFTVPNSVSKHQGNTATCIDVEALVNHLQCYVRFKLQTSRRQGTRVNRSAIEIKLNKLNLMIKSILNCKKNHNLALVLYNITVLYF